jgi:DNA-binding CsgD family transcriptional regulator
LTPTEQRVAALVTTGSTNDEIARELLMGVATVKTHLTHIYAKTGAANRTELAARHPRT